MTLKNDVEKKRLRIAARKYYKSSTRSDLQAVAVTAAQLTNY